MLKKLCNLVLMGVVVFSLVSCNIPFNRKHFHVYYSAGMKAMEQGDLRGARRNFGRALTNAESGHMKPSDRVDVLFHYSRVLGKLCEYQSAEKGFLRARKLTDEIRGDEGKLKRFHINAELARLNYDTGRYSQAVLYYEEAIRPAAELPETLTRSPVFSGMLADYSNALVKTGSPNKAEIVRKRLEALHREIPAMGKHSGHTIHTDDRYPDDRYPKECEGSGKTPPGHKHHEH